jgi:hypothetical protein
VDLAIIENLGVIWIHLKGNFPLIKVQWIQMMVVLNLCWIRWLNTILRKRLSTNQPSVIIVLICYGDSQIKEYNVLLVHTSVTNAVIKMSRSHVTNHSNCRYLSPILLRYLKKRKNDFAMLAGWKLRIKTVLFVKCVHTTHMKNVDPQ